MILSPWNILKKTPTSLSTQILLADQLIRHLRRVHHIESASTASINSSTDDLLNEEGGDGGDHAGSASPSASSTTSSKIKKKGGNKRFKKRLSVSTSVGSFPNINHYQSSTSFSANPMYGGGSGNVAASASLTTTSNSASIAAALTSSQNSFYNTSSSSAAVGDSTSIGGGNAPMSAALYSKLHSPVFQMAHMLGLNSAPVISQGTNPFDNNFAFHLDRQQQEQHGQRQEHQQHQQDQHSPTRFGHVHQPSISSDNGGAIHFYPSSSSSSTSVGAASTVGGGAAAVSPLRRHQPNQSISSNYPLSSTPPSSSRHSTSASVVSSFSIPSYQHLQHQRSMSASSNSSHHRSMSTSSSQYQQHQHHHQRNMSTASSSQYQNQHHHFSNHQRNISTASSPYQHHHQRNTSSASSSHYQHHQRNMSSASTSSNFFDDNAAMSSLSSSASHSQFPSLMFPTHDNHLLQSSPVKSLIPTPTMSNFKAVDSFDTMTEDHQQDRHNDDASPLWLTSQQQQQQPFPNHHQQQQSIIAPLLNNADSSPFSNQSNISASSPVTSPDWDPVQHHPQQQNIHHKHSNSIQNPTASVSPIFGGAPTSSKRVLDGRANNSQPFSQLAGFQTWNDPSSLVMPPSSSLVHNNLDSVASGGVFVSTNNDNATPMSTSASSSSWMVPAFERQVSLGELNIISENGGGGAAQLSHKETTGLWYEFFYLNKMNSEWRWSLRQS